MTVSARREVVRCLVARGLSPRRACILRQLPRSTLGYQGRLHGHVELVYDFADGGDADGWLHALFRYERRDNVYLAFLHLTCAWICLNYLPPVAEL